MRKNKLFRRIVPAVLSLVLMLNTGFTPVGTLAINGAGRKTEDVDISIGDFPFTEPSTEDTESEDITEEVTEEKADETTEEAETSEEDGVDGAPMGAILNPDGSISIIGGINGGALQDGPGKVYFICHVSTN